MNRLVRAELVKIRTTRLVWWMALGMAASVVLGVVGGILGADREGTFPLDSPRGVRNVIAAAGSGTTLVLVLGILGMTGEFRHGTITQTFLVTPERGRVVAAKLAAYTLVGLAFATVAAALTLAIALPWLSARDVGASFLSRDVGVVIVGAVVATMLYGTIGVSVGALARNQVLAVVVALVWVLVVEGLLVGLLPEVGRWLPGGAANALIGTTPPEGGLLPMWAGGLLFAGYGLAFSFVGNRFVIRRDVT